MADGANNNGAPIPEPLLFSVPPEVFIDITSHASHSALKALSQTCRSLRSNENLTRGAFLEPLSCCDFPLTKKQLNAIGFEELIFEYGKRGPRVFGFAAEMHDDM